MSDRTRYDVLRYGDGTERAVPAGDGRRVVEAHESEAESRRLTAAVAAGTIALVGVVAVGWVFLDALVGSAVVGVVAGTVGGVLRYRRWDSSQFVPEVVVSDAPPRVVSERIGEFDPDDVVDPFD